MSQMASNSNNNNTTVFLANQDPNVTEEELKQIFLQFGEIISVKIPATKGCGFVQFASRTSAEESIQRMQGNLIGQQVVQLSWGRNPAAKLDVAGIWGQSADATSQWSAHCAYGQGYDAYAYGATQDPSARAYGAYAGYLQYPQQVECCLSCCSWKHYFGTPFVAENLDAVIGNFDSGS